MKRTVSFLKRLIHLLMVMVLINGLLPRAIFSVTEIGGITAFSSITVFDAQELLAAISDASIDTIFISGVIEVSETVLIDRPLHLTGDGTILVSDAVLRVPWHQPSSVLAPYLASAWPGETSAIIRVESGVTISNITISGPATTTTRTHVSGIYVTNATGQVRLENITINHMHHGIPDGVMTDMGGFGVHIRNSDVEILNSRIENFNNQGIQQVGGNLLVQNTQIISSAPNNHLRARTGIQISPGSVSTTLIGNTISDLRFTGAGATASGIVAFDGMVIAEGNTFTNSDVAIIASGSWGSPNLTLADTNFDDDAALDTDIFIRLEGGTNATVTNHCAIWADRVHFAFGGGRYNGSLVTSTGDAATMKADGALPVEIPFPAIVSFYYPGSTQDMLQLQLPNIIGNRVANRLVVWAAVDGYVRLFPAAVPLGYTIHGWRDFAYLGEEPTRLPEPLPVDEPITIVPMTPTAFNVTYVVEGERPQTYSSIPETQNLQPGTTVMLQPNLTTTEMANASGVIGTWVFNGWTAADISMAGGSFIMPGNDVEFVGTWLFIMNTTSDYGGDYGNNIISHSPEIGMNYYHEYNAGEGVKNLIMFSPIHHAYLIGDDHGLIRPQDSITRAEAATVFFRLISDEYRVEVWTQDNNFTDVTINDWFNNAVSTMANAGVLVGMPDGTFQPNRAVSRAEFAAAMMRFFTEIPLEGINTFSDTQGHWAVSEISAMARMGIINGFPDGKFAPEQAITRAEAAAIINRMLIRLPETAEDLLPDMVVWPDNADVSAWFYLYLQEASNSNYFEVKENGINKRWTGFPRQRNWGVLERPYSRPLDIHES